MAIFLWNPIPSMTDLISGALEISGSTKSKSPER